MAGDSNHESLDAALRRCGASWTASQAHGLATARLCSVGAAARPLLLQHVLDDADAAGASRADAESLLGALFDDTWLSLTERQSAFIPLLPDDDEPADVRTEALAHWCEGFLHGLVSDGQSRGAEFAERLAAEPIADIIRDMLEITRAAADSDDDDEGSDAAYAEIVEYLRVAAQLVYEELAEMRPAINE